MMDSEFIDEERAPLPETMAMNRPFPKLSKNRTWGIFALSKI